ncbi:unnamed protein product, partial [Amoebophrya sp. A25]
GSSTTKQRQARKDRRKVPPKRAKVQASRRRLLLLLSLSKTLCGNRIENARVLCAWIQRHILELEVRSPVLDHLSMASEVAIN